MSEQPSGEPPEALGCTTPRLWTPPLRELTPATSVGFDQIEFARDVLKAPADPWQEWLLIHAGELLPDGRPRFRIVLVMAARQNGKTWTPVTLSSYWQFVEAVPMILGTSTKLDYARESWSKATKLARKIPALDAMLPPGRNRGIRNANGEQEMITVEDSRYKIAASNEEGGRSLTIDRAILDELRQHHDYSAWDAIIPAGNAVRHFQAWCLTNAGSDRSVVLNDLRDACLTFIRTGQGDPRVGLFEWSAPEGSSPVDMQALAQANPNLGRRIDPEALRGDAMRALEKGGEALIGFRTEQMCMSVTSDTPPTLPADSWAACGDAESVRDPDSALVFSLDVSPDRSTSAITMAANRVDGMPMVKVVRHGPGTGWIADQLEHLWRVKSPRSVVIDGIGPAHSMVEELKDRGIAVEVMNTSDMADACGSLYDAVITEQLRHCDQAEMNTAAAGAAKRDLGDRWAWKRRTSTSDITPLVSATAALWGLGKAGAPGVW